MSTRAIIGIQYIEGRALGTIIGAWQWNDGANLTRLLNSRFNTFDKAKALVYNGVWSTMLTQKELVQFLTKNTAGSTLFTDKTLVELNGVWLLKDKHHLNVEPAIYNSYEHAAGQDVNHIYLYNTVTNKWCKDAKLV